MADRTKRTPKKRDWQTAFLAALDEGMTVTKACATAHVARSNAYDERDRSEQFAVAWDDIIERTTEDMEAEAYRRAVDGWRERPILDEDGNEVGEVRKHSDTLLIFLLKARRPATYRDNHRVEHVGHDGGPVNVRVELDDKQRKALSGVLRGRPATRSE